IAQQSSSVIAAGTSVAVCFPFFIAASMIGTCHSHGVALYTRSRSSVSHRRSKSRGPRVYAAGAGCPASAIALAAQSVRSGRTSQTAVMRHPGIFRRLRTCPDPWPPMPTYPIRTVGIAGAANRDGPDCASTGALRITDVLAAMAVPLSFRKSRRSIRESYARCGHNRRSAMDDLSRTPVGPSLWITVRDALRGTRLDYTTAPVGRAVITLAVPMVVE